MQLAVIEEVLKVGRDQRKLTEVQRLTVEGVEIWVGQDDDGYWRMWSPTSRHIRFAKCHTLREARSMAVEVAIGRYVSTVHKEYLKSWQIRLNQYEAIAKSYM